MNISPNQSDGHPSSSQESDGLFSDTAKRCLNFSDEMSPTSPSNGPQQQLTPSTESDGLDPLFPDPTANQILDDETDGPDRSANQMEDESDGLDPLFSDTVPAKSVGDFVDEDDRRDFGVEFGFDAVKRKKRTERRDGKRKVKESGDVAEAKKLKVKVHQERKVRIAEQADFQRVMRERKGVGFKPMPMVEKPISSVLEKIRQRKLEMLRKVMPTKIVDKVMPAKIVQRVTAGDSDKDDDVLEILDSVQKKVVCPEPVPQRSAVSASSIDVPVDVNSDDKPSSSDEQARSKSLFVEGTENSFRAPLNDTQDLFSDSQTSESQEQRDNEEPSSPVEDVAPSLLPSLNLRLEDSIIPDDISSDEEDSDKENADPGPQPQRKDRERGDPVMDFLDEEALEDDSDDELIHSEDKDEEEEDADVEEHCDYITADYKEQPVDEDRRNLLHQTWLQQHDEEGTEKLLQKLKYGAKPKETSFLSDEDDDKMDDEDVDRVEEDEDESDEDGSEGHVQSPRARVTTKKLKQMIPRMFTDEDDGFVSSEDEETERRMSRFQLLQKVESEQHSKFMSPAEDETSKIVFSRIRKLNVVPETRKKAKITSFFDALVTKGSSSNSAKSSFLQRASSFSVTSSNRSGSGTGRSFIFGRDDSRSSLSVDEDSPDTNQNGSQEKRSASAKFTSSQPKRCTQRTEPRDGKASGTSLFEILKRSSMQTGRDTRGDRVDHQPVFAAFKPVKKQIKVDGRH